ncbi:MAG TPA: PHP domain-containing protein, partial [Microbacterium sp.]|uniref:PHP domain-containing protein n=1 Tax=Microbacterium sp. TaxID=51671 RepID=UPI002B48EDA4
MDPRAALLEIASLLERERASRYRSKAFRTAAAAIDGLTDAQLRDPALGSRPGIGDTSLAVIRQALDGRVPDYLADLRRRYAPEASALRTLLRGDLHSHSDWSDGLTPIDDMAAAAIALGHEYLALTDHSPRLRVANGLSPERLRAQLPIVRGFGTGSFTLLTGIEVDILEDGALDQEPELLADLDIVVASAHSKLRMERLPMTRRLVAAASDPHTDVLGHVTGRLVGGDRGTRPPSEFEPKPVFEACAAHGVAVEINSRPER